MKQPCLRKYHIKMILVLPIAAVMTLIFLSVLYRFDNKYTIKTNITQDRTVLVPNGQICYLTDGWEFYPDKLLTPQDFDDPTLEATARSVAIGDDPNLSRFHEDANPYGTATYRLRLRGDGMYSLYLQEPLCAVKVYAGGVLLGENGNVNPENYRPLIQDRVFAFPVDGETELIIQTANYSHYYGGIYYPPALGDGNSISRMIAARMAFYGFLCFSSLVLALFCAALWLEPKGGRDQAAFYFGLLSLSFSLRVCYPFLRFLGVPLVRSLYALEDAAALAGLYCVIRLSLLLFAPGFSGRFKTFVCSVSMGMCAAGVVVPLLILPWFPAFTVWYGMIISWYKLLFSAILLGIALYGVIAGHPQAGFGLAAVTAYGVCLFASVFAINEFEPIRTGWQDEYGSFFLVLLFGAVMLRRNQEMKAENLRLTSHLKEEVDEKTQHLVQLLNERSELMAEFGHDIKSPVTVISNIAQIIQRGNVLLDDDSREKLQFMEERCGDLADRVRSIQAFATEAGGPSKMEDLSLNQFLSDFHRDLKPVIELFGPDFVCSLTRLPCTVHADPGKLRRAFENLVFNAADFTPSTGTIRLTLLKEEGYAAVYVADTGCGIPEDALPKLFDRFYTTRAGEGGQGLGLAITKAILAEHRGEITVQSEVGAGTTFTVRLPLLEGQR